MTIDTSLKLHQEVIETIQRASVSAGIFLKAPVCRSTEFTSLFVMHVIVIYATWVTSVARSTKAASSKLLQLLSWVLISTTAASIVSTPKHAREG